MKYIDANDMRAAYGVFSEHSSRRYVQSYDPRLGHSTRRLIMTAFILRHHNTDTGHKTSVELATPPDQIPDLMAFLMAVAGTEDADYRPGGTIIFSSPNGSLSIERA